MGLFLSHGEVTYYLLGFRLIRMPRLHRAVGSIKMIGSQVDGSKWLSEGSRGFSYQYGWCVHF